MIFQMTWFNHYNWQLLNTTERLVYMTLVCRINPECICWPSQRTIAKDCDLSVRQTKRIIKQLKVKEFIRYRKGSNYSGKSNIYYVVPIDKVTFKAFDGDMHGTTRVTPVALDRGHQCHSKY